MVSPPPSSTVGSDSPSQHLSTNNNETIFHSYRDLSASEILTETKDLQSQGIIYATKENIASECEFIYNKDITGNILVPKDKTNKISEFVLTGIFEIDRGLCDAPVISAGIRSFLWNLVE
jgi:hypothetical protein